MYTVTRYALPGTIIATFSTDSYTAAKAMFDHYAEQCKTCSDLADEVTLAYKGQELESWFWDVRFEKGVLA